MVTDDQDISEIIRNGGEFWVVEVQNTDGSGTWRPWVRSVDRDEARDAYKFEKARRPDLSWRPRMITVTATVLNWEGLDFG